MTENTTTPVPSDLLARIAAASSAGKVEELRSLAMELPAPPPAPRLVLVDLNRPDVLHTQALWAAVNPLEQQGKAGGLGALLSRIDHSPDVLAVIDEQLTEWWTESDSGIDALRHRIRTALTASAS